MTLGCYAGLEGWACSVAWMMMIALFFVAAICRRQISEWLDVGFSLIGATVLAEVVFVIMMFITQDIKIGAIAGVVGVLAGGFIGAMFLGDTE